MQAKPAGNPTSSQPHARRIVLLGASNLTRGISTAIETVARVWGRPLDVLAAFGHGRSYGMRSAVLARELPGIIECGLWRALGARPPAPTAALITDVGNDILYEADVEQIVAWVADCVARLERADARIVMTQLPLETLARLSESRFRLLRTILFPRSRLTFADALRQATDLNERLRSLCSERAIPFVAPRAKWFGFDPIHIRMRHWPRAWRELLAPLAPDGPKTKLPDPAPASLRRWLTLRRLVPERRWWFGIEQRRTQPAGRLTDGTVLAFY